MSTFVSRVTMLVVVVAGLALVNWPAEADDKGSLPPDLAHVPGKAAVMLSLRPADLWEHELAKGIRGKLGKDATFLAEQIAKEVGLVPAETERVTMAVPNIGPGSSSTILFVVARKAMDREKLLAAVVPGGEEKTHAGQKYFANERRAVLFLDARHYVLGTVGDVQSVIDSGKAKDDSPLAPALKLAAAKHAAVVAIDPEQLEKLSDELPADAEPFKPLLKAKLGTLVLDAGTNMKGELRVKFPGAGEAKAGAKAVEIARKMALELIDQFGQRAGKMAEMEVFLKLAKQAGDELKRAKVVQDGATVSAAAEMKLDDKTLGPVLGESLAKVRAAAARMQSSNNLKQIALAMHNYESANGHFPPAAVYDKDGKALLSWRVLLLPYLEQDALYREFKLDEAWDSPHNKKLLAKMPALFQVPNAKPQHAHGTFYQVLYGKGAAFEGKTGNTIVAFTDGTSNTILAVESDKDVPWSKPEDVPFDDAKDVPRLGDHHGGGLFMAAFADGSVRAIKHTINKDALKALITRAGGEVIGNDD